ncbi:angiotensin-converting enzyme [Elysia marginata]|uniref:Angiotensin-converting enzyme n=1 Tax=Elysia marginata TaxID=1093978 RepID=A0AAV4FUK5_9GAST|nr:angiotensin-converting enzyme [Elysia marginata]
MTGVRVLTIAVYISLMGVQKCDAWQSVVDFLNTYEREGMETLHSKWKAEFVMGTNYTKENTETYHEANLELASFVQRNNKKALAFLQNDTVKLSPDQTRQLRFIADMGTAAQTDKHKINKLNKIETEMTAIYNQAEVCLGSPNSCLKMEPGLSEVIQKSRDCKVLSETWQKWRDQSGKKMRHLFPEYVKLSNEAVNIQGYSDLGEYWRSEYDTPTFERDIARLWEQVSPLYQHLHGYVRRKLKAMYGPDVFPLSGHIPAHLLGNMWAQFWENIAEIVKPFKHKDLVDTTEELLRQNYTVKRMFETAEEFFSSLGFENMTDKFWNKSMFVQPKDRHVHCQASAYDLFNKDDFRIRMCSLVNHEYLLMIHHEMGHIQYFMEYSKQPLSYRKGANPGFHEAVGDAISKSVQTPQHLRTIGLIKSDDKQDKETGINFLMQMALHNIAFLPFGYLIDQWRWSVFRGDTAPDQYNEHWWKLRCRLQGVSPPMKRSTDDFDPGSKFHVARGIPYVRSMLQLGASKPWPDAMEKITGQRHMDAGPLMEYFQPLLEFLKKENGNDYGWDESCPEEPPPCFADPDGAHGLRIGWATLVVLSVLALFIGSLQTSLR